MLFRSMNVLGNRHIANNIRILLVNNGRGVRFRVTPALEVAFGEDIDELIAASGHNGSAEGWARSMGFEYLSANNKDEFLSLIDDFCSPKISQFDKPVFFEVFPKVKDEQNGLKLIREANKSMTDALTGAITGTLKGVTKQFLPKKALNALRKLKDGNTD